MQGREPIILVHGGVGSIPELEIPQRLGSLEAAVRAADELLAAGGSALDAAVHAVAEMEDAPLLNAGWDCCLNLDGEAELDASVMDSDGLAAGVGAVRDVRHPVRLARAVAERTEHRLMVAGGAGRLARLLGLPMRDPVSGRARRRHADLLDRLRDGGVRGSEAVEAFAWRRLPELSELYGLHSTVGAVALDMQGRLAAATSTGGIWLKLPGRVGDSAVIGAGTWCDGRGAASATGMGDGILRLSACRAVVELTGLYRDVGRAAKEVVAQASAARVDCGLIVLAPDGSFAVQHNCRHLPHALVTGPERTVRSGT
jgi:L-asparaginase / beta-aspartyl-peptidase